MKFKFFFLVSAIAAIVGCGKSTHYTINGRLELPEFNNSQIYLIDMTSNEPVDSTQMSNGTFHFEGEVENAYMSYIVAVGDGINARLACVIEPGEIYIDLNSDSLSGTQMNEELYAFSKASQASKFATELYAYLSVYRSATTIEERMEAERAYDSIDALRIAALSEAALATFENNTDNIVGAYVLTCWATEALPTASEVESKLSLASNDVKQFAPLQTILKQLQAIERTCVGKKYTDIDGIDFATGEKCKLSQMIEGKLTLVDFWASWCRPCRQEISENLIRIYKEYNKKGLQVVGIDVWDKPEEHKVAVANLGIPYPQLIDTTRNATTNYGISGIPQILLIGTDGTIIARDLRGPAIEEAIIAALKK